MGAVIAGPFPANLFRRGLRLAARIRAAEATGPAPVPGPRGPVLMSDGTTDLGGEPLFLRDWREAETRDD